MTEPQLNFRKYKSHQKKHPWNLILKLLLAAVVIGLLVWVRSSARKENPKKSQEIELIFDQ